MDNNLSELGKPVFEIEISDGYWLNCSISPLQPRDGAKFNGWPDGVNRLYSQEYVSALEKVAQYWIGESAGWQKRAEDAEKRIAELEQVPTIKHMRSVEESLIRATDMVSELEKRLATPVRLSCETHPRCRTQHAKDVRAAGFKVMGDEQC
ncbi:TPA: hypothetical protein SML79_000308 [Serratia marcescens]|nr:hypothetical protein [Serratia marcescens]